MSDRLFEHEVMEYIRKELQPVRDDFNKVYAFFLGSNPLDPEDREKGFLRQMDLLRASAVGNSTAIGALEATLQQMKEKFDNLEKRFLDIEQSPPAVEAREAKQSIERAKFWAKVVAYGLAAFMAALAGYLKVS